MDDENIKVQSVHVTVPSFLRLFVMRRILHHCNMSVDQIKQMVTVINDLNHQQIAQDILTQLINDGIKQYMKKWFNEKEQREIIEIIFIKIILKRFEKEYRNIVTYNCQRNDYYQRLVFNSDDLMCLIFQFVELNEMFNGDLINCSLVNSHWLYQSWNPNSVHHCCLTTMIKNTIANTSNMNVSKKWNNLDRILSSKWQRVVKVKSLTITLYHVDNWERLQLEYLMEKISTLRNVVNLSLDIFDTYVAILKGLVYYNKKNIEKYLVLIRGCNISTRNNKFKTLELMNAQNIYISNMYYYIKWSYKCKILKLRLEHIGESWIKYVIDNCDCSGVQTLIMQYISFSESTQLLLNKFCQKFKNLQSLNITLEEKITNMGLILSLLRCLSPIMKENNAMLVLQIYASFPDRDELVKTIQDTEIKVGRLIIVIDEEKSIDCFKPILLKNSKLEYLKLNTWFYFDDTMQEYLLNMDMLGDHRQNLPLLSLKMIDINDIDSNTSMSTINQILRLKLISKRKIYLKMSFDPQPIHYQVLHDQESFETMCQAVASLLIYHQVPIELDIIIRSMTKSHFIRTYYPIFRKYLNENALKNIKAPIVNKYCNVLFKPVVSLKFERHRHDENDPKGQMVFQASNVTENCQCTSQFEG